MTDITKMDLSILAYLVLASCAFFLGIGSTEAGTLYWISNLSALVPALLAFCIACLPLYKKNASLIYSFVTVGGVFLGAVPVLILIDTDLNQSFSALGLWLYVLSLGFYAWKAMEMMAAHSGKVRGLSLVVPLLFGMWLIYLWQVVTTGFKIPSVLLPSPELIGLAIAGNLDILEADFYQTFVKSVLSGFAFGCGSGFLVAILVDRIPFMQRGLLPLGSLVSAIPIVGIAPIMVMWFGFDWQSKAAVIVVMTFFPMLVNTLAGLQATSHLEKDLMRSYAASYFQTLIFVRIPNALPFIFNALKINSTLALIGAIVAEFFGTPIVGMGFRISTEVGRMNVDIVWATIAVAALAGSLFYGILALIERTLTFWHPSYRSAKR
ncbi:MAG: ABC transporter permease [Sneathiellales bacterium]|nr:ABC transporter permease [Sneathiellales bacterium]